MVSLTRPSLQVLGKTQTGIFLISRFLVNPLKNSRTTDDINKKFGPVTKLDKRNKRTSKKLTMTPFRQIVISLSFFRFMANLEQSRSRIPFIYKDFKILPQPGPQNELLKSRTRLGLSVNPTKWSNTLEQFVGKSQQIV